MTAPLIVLSCDPFSKVTVVNAVQPWNAAHSISSTLAGISIDVSEVQFVNAPKPIQASSSYHPPIVLSCDPFSKVALVNAVQFWYIAAVDYQQLADNTVEKSCVFDTRD